MGSTQELEIDANFSKPDQDRVPTLSDLVSEEQGYHIVISEPDDATGTHLYACPSLVNMINCPLVHPPLRYDTDQVSSQ